MDELELETDFTDFDQMFSEEVQEKDHSYKLFGVEGIIPAKLPFGIVLQYERNKKRKDEEAGIELTISMLETIFGKEVVDIWASNPRFDSEKMTKVLQWALKKYGLGAKEDSPKVNRGKLKVVKSE